MPHVVGFSVDGLAGRSEPVSMALDRHVNVFWGYNGSGKTTLLKIIASALSDQAETLRRLPFSAASVTIDTGIFGPITRTIEKSPNSSIEDSDELFTDFTIADRLIERQTDRANRPIRWVTLSPEKGGRELRRIPHTYLPISRVTVGDRPYRSGPSREAIDDDVFDEMFARQIERRWQAYNNQALAQLQDIQQRGLGEILSLLFGGVEGKARNGSVTTIADDLAYSLVRDYLRGQNIRVNFDRKSFASRYSNSTELQAVVQRIRRITGEMVQVLRPQDDFRALLTDLFGGEKVVRLTPDGIRVSIADVEVSLPSLSSGERQLLQILLQTLAGRDNAVIIDEPELSMHVDWQLRLVESMQILNPECQLILATHSPEVMARVPAEQVHQL